MENNGCEYAVDVRNLNKQFDGKRVVNDLSLQVKRGEIVGFLGPNGSGKTTAIRMICGLLTPDGGEGTCLGHDILTQRDAIKRDVGYMTQNFSYWEDLSIRENLDFIARVYELADRQRIVTESLENLGLASRSDQLAGSLSGGWKQRLALEACMLRHPKLLLLDEPTAGVDPGARKDFWEELHNLASKGVSVLVSTHYMDEAERCHRLAYIADGRLLVQGSPEEIKMGCGIYTYEVDSSDLIRTSQILDTIDSAEQTVIFGTALHVSGRDSHALETALKGLAIAGVLAYKAIPTSLEDVFIHLMSHSSTCNGENSGTL